MTIDVFYVEQGPLAIGTPGTIGGYPISSLFGFRTDPITGQKGSGHGGIDQPMVGRKIAAVGRGSFQPLYPANSGGGGNWAGVLLDNGDYWAVGHCDAFRTDLRYGDVVDPGELIAWSGNTGRSTGPHAHVSRRRRGEWAYSDPYDDLVEAAAAGRFPFAPPPITDPKPFPPPPQEEADMPRATYELREDGFAGNGETWVETPTGLGQAVSPSLLNKQRQPNEGHPAVYAPPIFLTIGEMESLLTEHHGPGFATEWRKTKGA